MAKEYIGDGIYAEITSYDTLLVTTSDGEHTTNTIVFGPIELEALNAFVKRVMESETTCRSE